MIRQIPLSISRFWTYKLNMVSPSIACFCMQSFEMFDAFSTFELPNCMNVRTMMSLQHHDFQLSSEAFSKDFVSICWSSNIVFFTFILVIENSAFSEYKFEGRFCFRYLSFKLKKKCVYLDKHWQKSAAFVWMIDHNSELNGVWQSSQTNGQIGIDCLVLSFKIVKFSFTWFLFSNFNWFNYFYTAFIWYGIQK